MTRICKKIAYAILSVLLSVWALVAGIFPAAIPVSAETTTAPTFEKTNVMDDLKTSTINGESFDLMNYGFNAFKDTQVLSFVEYCYSFYPEKQGNYGLYVYVYNPKGLKFDTESSLNTVQFAYGESTSTNYAKYPLKFLNCSIETNYEGLFYKFKVGLTDEQRQSILATVNSTERYYRVSGIELLTNGNTNATDYTVATTYKFLGYAAGHGSNENADSTLKVESEQAEVLTLNVHSTAYRPEGTNGKNDYTQDSLHSVYFAVPNDVINRYGAMTAVHATWLNAVLKPALVTGNQSAYEAINGFLGVDMSSHNENLNYMYLGAYAASANLSSNVHHHGYSYNATTWTGNTLNKTFYGEQIDKLYLNFYAGSGTDSADNYTLSSETIIEALKDSKTRFGGTLVNGKYSKAVFESVDSEFTEVNIQADENYSLTSEVVSGNFWSWLFGADGYKTTTFDGIKAIYPVKDSDLEGTTTEVSNRLYISEGDCEEFKSFYEANKSLCTVYLFRYQTSEYEAQEASLLQETKNWLGIEQWEKVDSNAYFFKQTVNLDFDIIDVTFSNGKVETVIPVVADPIDIVPDATPPVHTTSDKQPNWWLIIIAVILVIVLIICFPQLLPYIAKGVVWFVTLPIKGIKALRKKAKERKERKNKE